MIVAGFGFRGAATAASLQDALIQTGLQDKVTALATADDKAGTAAFVEFSEAVGLPVHCLAPDLLADVATQTNSYVVRQHRQTGSLAEASALSAAGSGARLLGPRTVSSDRMATCALACGARKGESI